MYQHIPTSIITNIYVTNLIAELLLTTVFLIISKGMEKIAVTNVLIIKIIISMS